MAEVHKLVTGIYSVRLLRNNFTGERHEKIEVTNPPEDNHY